MAMTMRVGMFVAMLVGIVIVVVAGHARIITMTGFSAAILLFFVMDGNDLKNERPARGERR